MKKIQSGQGVTDLGSIDEASGIDRMGRGETPTEVVDKPVLEGTPDRTVTFTGHAAEGYNKVKALGGSDEAAYVHAEAIQNLMDDIEDQVLEREPTPEEFSDPKNWHPVEGPYLTEPPTVTEVDMINHPPHYTSHPSGVEAIEITRWMMFDPGNALKYVMRLGLKGSARDDADKARFYLEDALGHCDRIWGILDFINFGDQIDEAKKQLLQVAEAEPDFIKAMFYHALYEGRMERALRAVNALLERYE